MFGFSKMVAKCNEQYSGDSLYPQRGEAIRYCTCGNILVKSLIYAESSDTLVPVLACRKCHTIVKL